MNSYEAIEGRFNELEEILNDKKIDGLDKNEVLWLKWASNVLNLLKIAFGSESDYYKSFEDVYKKFEYLNFQTEKEKGIFLAAKEDFEKRFVFSLENRLYGKILGDFVLLAREALRNNKKDVAAVLISASLEDILKKYAIKNGLEDDDKSIQEVINFLKSKGLIHGAQNPLLKSMAKTRNYAMHANWDKITSEEVSSIIGFIEQFLIDKFIVNGN
jgi:hypothetical protein